MLAVAKTKRAREQIVREPSDIRPINTIRVIVALPLDGDPIFSSTQLVLQTDEILIRAQLRIVFGDGEQPPQSTI